MTKQSPAIQASFERLKIGPMETILAPRPGSGLVAATATLHRGSADEQPGEFGLAAFTMSMLMRGTTRRSSEQMAFDLESIGAMAGDETGMDRSALSMQSAVEEAPEALGILFEALRAPAFDPAEHEIHRQETLASLRMIEDEKFSFTFRQYLKLMFAGHGYGHPTEGDVADVMAITPESCRRWHDEIIRPETILFAAAGDFDVAAWQDMLAKLVEGWPAGADRPRQRIQAAPPAHDEAGVDLTKPDLQQGFIVGGFRTPPITHEDYPALRLASAVLGEGFGGRLFSILRDRKSLAYAVGASLNAYRLGGHQILYIGTKPETIDEAREGLFAEAKLLQESEPAADEFDRAREYVIGKYLMGHQSLGQRISHLAWWEDVAGDAALDASWPDRLRAVTPGQIREAAARWWHEPTLAILRPEI